MPFSSFSLTAYLSLFHARESSSKAVGAWNSHDAIDRAAVLVLLGHDIGERLLDLFCNHLSIAYYTSGPNVIGIRSGVLSNTTINKGFLTLISWVFGLTSSLIFGTMCSLYVLRSDSAMRIYISSKFEAESDRSYSLFMSNPMSTLILPIHRV